MYLYYIAGSSFPHQNFRSLLF